MKKLISCVLLLLLLSLAGCGGSPAPGAETPASEPEAEREPVSEPEPAPEPEPEVNALDLTGQWKEVDPESEDEYYGAVIDGDKIELHLTCDDGGTRYLYWSGSYIPPEEDVDSYSWTSQVGQRRIDTEAIAAAEGTKDFIYYENQLLCSVSDGKLERQIKMEREEWAPGLGISDVPDELKSGFDPATNKTFTYDGITFSYPAYFTHRFENPPDDPEHFPEGFVEFYQPENPNYHAYLQFNTIELDRRITQEEFYEIGREDAKGRGEEGYLDVEYDETNIAGRPAYLFNYKKYFLHEGLIFTTARLAYINNPKAARVIYLKLCYGNGDMSGYDYAGDFQKILDSARLAS